MATVVDLARSIAPVVTLYVNSFNAPARAAYQRALRLDPGFESARDSLGALEGR